MPEAVEENLVEDGDMWTGMEKGSNNNTIRTPGSPLRSSAAFHACPLQSMTAV